MGLFQLHDGDAESRDDIVRMEIEDASKNNEDYFWDWLGADDIETFDKDGSVW